MPTQTCTPRYVDRRACRDTHVQTHTRADAHTCSRTQAQISFSVCNTRGHTLHHVALRGTALHYTAPLCNAHPQRATFHCAAGRWLRWERNHRSSHEMLHSKTRRARLHMKMYVPWGKMYLLYSELKSNPARTYRNV